MPVETPVRRRWRVRHRPRLIPCLLALVAVLLVIKWIDPFANRQREAPQDVPDWVEVNLLPVNPYSRPGIALEQVNGIVIHYVGNPGTTAAQNHSFFTNLAQTGETYASSHFVVGLEGEVIQCIPLTEIAYASNIRNDDTNHRVTTVLLEGAVTADTREHRCAPIRLRPAQQLVYDTRKGEMRLTDCTSAEASISWIDGHLHFDRSTFAEIVAELKRYYNVDVHFTDASLRNERFSGDFHVEDGIYHIMSVLQLTYKFTYKVVGNDIEIYPNSKR